MNFINICMVSGTKTGFVLVKCNSDVHMYVCKYVPLWQNWLINYMCSNEIASINVCFRSDGNKR